MDVHVKKKSDLSASGTFKLPAYLCITVIVSVSYLAGYKMLQGYFIDDDFAGLLWYKHVGISDVLSMFSFPNREYRPVSYITFFSITKAFGLEPFWYHLFNITLHALNSALVFFFCRMLLNNKAAAFLAALLFSCLHLHMYTLFVCFNFGEPLVLSFMLSALICFHRYLADGGKGHYWLALTGFSLALLTKENSLIFVLVIILLSLVRRKRFGLSLRKMVLVNLPFVIITAMFGLSLVALNRFYVFEGAGYHIGWNMIPALLEHMSGLCSFTLVQEPPLAVYPAIAAAAACLLVLGSNTVRFLLAWILVFSLPYSPFMVNFNRALYIPSIGFCALSAAAIIRLSGMTGKKRRYAGRACGFVMVSCLVAANIALSHASIAGYNKRSFALKNMAEMIPSIEHDVPKGAFVFLVNSPDETWIAESVFRLFLNDPDLGLLGFDANETTEKALAKIGDNTWTRNMIRKASKKEVSGLIIVDYKKDELRVKQSVNLKAR